MFMELNAECHDNSTNISEGLFFFREKVISALKMEAIDFSKTSAPVY
jgi:hypothetical protein